MHYFLNTPCSKHCLRVRLGFVKPIQNGLSKKHNLIKSRPSRAEIDLTGRENGVKTPESKNDAFKKL